MKKIILSLFVLVLTYATNAQIETPAPSPSQKIEQRVGLTDITVAYSRPSVKGRKIFGGLEQYGKVWRTGANARTKITFSSEVTIAGNTLEKGTYAIFTRPNETAWDIYFYTAYKGSGAPKTLDMEKVAAQLKVTPTKLVTNVETMTITFDNLTKNSAIFNLSWEAVSVGFTITTPTDMMVTKSIDTAMAGPSAQDMFSAAVYYLQNEQDIDKAKVWIDKAVEMTAAQPRFWYLRQQSLVHAKAGSTKTAIAAAKMSLELATKAGNDAYINMNTASLKEWGAM
ncbi:MAG: hypothetical protein ACI9JT_001870 [Polaribacter sp.]|jgi:hypothetical protein